MNVLGVLNGEFLKLRKRPAVYVCIGILLLLLLAFGYLLNWVIFTYTKPPSGPNGLPPGVTYAELKKALYPLRFIQNTLGGGTTLGGVLALIIGVLAQGSEFGWGTVKTAFTQRPRRLEWLAGKLISVALTMLLMSVVLLMVAALTSFILATIDGADRTWPDAATVVKGLLAAWLIYCFWAFFGIGLATLFRQSAMAIGLGLAYALVIEALIFGLLSQFVGDPVRKVQQWFPLANANYLVQSFGEATRVRGAAAVKPYADATHAVTMLLVYCAAFVILSAVFIQRRDVTS
jgi:ABC-type transport system involved in multi-copper enzyme maturation permease subunit